MFDPVAYVDNPDTDTQVLRGTCRHAASLACQRRSPRQCPLASIALHCAVPAPPRPTPAAGLALLEPGRAPRVRGVSRDGASQVEGKRAGQGACCFTQTARSLLRLPSYSLQRPCILLTLPISRPPTSPSSPLPPPLFHGRTSSPTCAWSPPQWTPRGWARSRPGGGGGRRACPPRPASTSRPQWCAFFKATCRCTLPIDHCSAEGWLGASMQHVQPT